MVVHARTDKPSMSDSSGFNLFKAITVLALVLIVWFAISIARAPSDSPPSKAWRNLTAMMFILIVSIPAWVTLQWDTDKVQ